jgi:hypothetical protein
LQQVVETGEHDLVGLPCHAKVRRERRAGPAHGTGLREQRALQGREVAHANEARTARHGLRHFGVADAVQDAREAIATAGDQGQVGAAGRSAVQCSQARGVVAGKARVARERIGIDLDLVAECAQARDAAPKCRFVDHSARRGIDIDVARTGRMRGVIMRRMRGGVDGVGLGGMRGRQNARPRRAAPWKRSGREVFHSLRCQGSARFESAG